MTDKTTWQAGTARITGGGLDALMILAAMERLEKKVDALRDSIKSKRRERRAQKA